MPGLFIRGKSPEITSYDVVKTFALITMIIDHLGGFIWQDILIFKAVGRWSFPVWLFLIGYSNKRQIPVRLWVATALITTSYWVFHHDFLPLNIFATIIATRLLLPLITRPLFYNPIILAITFFVSLAAVLPSYNYVEYGITGLLFGFWGHLRRTLPCPQWLQHGYAFALFFIHSGIQMIIYPFSVLQQQLVLFGIMMAMLMMHYFNPKTYQNTKNIPILSPFFRFCGRYTLEIYTVHIIAFTIISAYLYMALDTVTVLGFSFNIPVGEFARK